MESPQASGNPALRTFVVLALALIIVAIDATDLRRIWIPTGVFGYGTNLDGVVTGVTPGSPASHAGLRVGDRLDKATMDPQQLEDLIQIPGVSAAGVSRTFGVYRGGVRRTVTLVAVSEPMNAGVETIIIVGMLGTLLCIGVGVAALLLRPEPVTWAFFIVSLGYAPISVDGFYSMIASPYMQYAQMFFDVLQAAGAAALLMFAVLFLQPVTTGWRRLAMFGAPFLFLAGATVRTIGITNTYFLGTVSQWTGQWRLAIEAVCYLAVIIALIDTYSRQHGGDRQRIRWVVLGFGITLVARLAYTIVNIELTNTPLALQSGLILVQAMGPLAVAYAIVKHRVIDINFVVSRTLVYGILTAFFVGLFALIDWFVGHVLDQTRWATIAEIGVAISVGFWLNGLHARVDEIVDRVLFRRRHAAEHRLERLTRGLPHAESIEAVDAALVSEPCDALDLTMGALYRANDRGEFARRGHARWSHGTPADVPSSDPLVLHLQAERGALRLAELHWSFDGSNGNTARPVLALPIIVRHELDAIVLFGGHRGGEDFDPDELRWLNALAAAAGAAYDHLEADALRKELERVTRESAARLAALEQHGLIPLESP